MTQSQSTELLKAVSFMRKYQREYFEARRLNQHIAATEALRKAKGFESRVDALLQEISGSTTAQQELFAK